MFAEVCGISMRSDPLPQLKTAELLLQKLEQPLRLRRRYFQGLDVKGGYSTVSHRDLALISGSGAIDEMSQSFRLA